jgi:hypothetical protein
MDLKSFIKQVHTPFSEVEKAFQKVRKELEELGLLWDGSKLDTVNCLHDSFPVECVQKEAEALWKKERNAIIFPRFYFAGGKKDSTIDVIRHEFGHALADQYRRHLTKGDLFREAFGGNYSASPAKGTDPDDWKGRCVSEYATSATQEDFAETFMLFVKHKGKIPAKYAKKPMIVKKWKAVAEIVKRVAAMTR